MDRNKWPGIYMKSTAHIKAVLNTKPYSKMRN
jgi:hypothetical protein